MEIVEKQGRIHGKTVADGWAGAVMQKPFEIQKYLGRTDLPTDRLKIVIVFIDEDIHAVGCPLIVDY